MWEKGGRALLMHGGLRGDADAKVSRGVGDDGGGGDGDVRSP